MEKWQVVGATSRGTSHVRLGTNCQDAHGYKVIDNRGVILVVADGLGSAKNSEFGSKIAVDIALDRLTEQIKKSEPKYERDWRNAIKRAFALAKDQIIKESKEKKLTEKDLATTLIVVVRFNKWLIVGQIGDGAVVIQDKNRNLKVISAPQRGEFANSTIPITAKNSLKQIFRYANQEDIISIACFSDGLQNLALDVKKNLPFDGFFRPFFDSVSTPINIVATSKDIESFLESEKVCAKTDDDKTILIAGLIENSDEEIKWEITSQTTEILSQPEEPQLLTGEKERFSESKGRPSWLRRFISIQKGPKKKKIN